MQPTNNNNRASGSADGQMGDTLNQADETLKEVMKASGQMGEDVYEGARDALSKVGDGGGTITKKESGKELERGQNHTGGRAPPLQGNV